MGYPAANYDESRRAAAYRPGVKESVLWHSHDRRTGEKEVKNPPYFSSDISEFLFLLSNHNVRFLLVGGEAVIFYGYGRLTGDIDIFYDRTEGNSRNLYETLSEFWNGKIPGVKNYKELMRKGMVFQFGVPPNRIDLINDIDGVSFDDAWEGKVVTNVLHDRIRIPLYYIGLNDLIKNKSAVRRNKDRDDLKFLKEVRKRRER